ncbi:putative membrane protein [Rhodoblastus sphagnicola]|uniref:hypothetical protein n=1 Tax=Rhodoblastus sphagnicola TaxID=333368 RepID=UPI00179AF0D6|nr:hypothetical protein [Rhodoblastus sphagnicola]MBB4200343.1 putative membrane protein [Rhodoblastus sphagnicola]
MPSSETIVAVFSQHPAAESAAKTLAANGFDIKNLSLIGKGHHTDEKVIGFYNTGDRVKLWGSRGAFWGLFFGGLFITIPAVGPVAALGYLAAALFSIAIPRDSVLQYETDVKADGFLVMARGAPEDIARAKDLLRAIKPSRLDAHPTATAAPSVAQLVAANAQRARGLGTQLGSHP